MRALALLAVAVAAVTVSAQGTKSPPPATTQQDAKSGAGTKAPAQTKAAPGTKTSGLSVAPETAPRPQITIMREVFDYDAAGRRDPFLSLITSDDLRPAVSDLRLVNIIFDETGRRPIAVMRDIQTNTQYRVTTGSTLGRLKVALIKRRAVIFSIEEFGLNRQDSVVMGDTTKARTR